MESPAVLTTTRVTLGMENVSLGIVGCNNTKRFTAPNAFYTQQTALTRRTPAGLRRQTFGIHVTCAKAC